MTDESGLWNHIGKGRERPLYHVIIPLMGRLKGDTGNRNHLKDVTNKIDSKLIVRWWLERLNYELIRQGQINGPA